MTYKETVEWMFKQLPMYQNLGKAAYKKDLSNTLRLSDYLKNPESKFKSIHVAGTNGKGSVSHMLASVLQESGYKVGLYTSPHLKDFRERIKINGKEISKHFVIGFIKKHQKFFKENNLSFFEMTVGLAFDYFAKQEVDIAIIEVGLGGRLDSTNIITPEVSVITNIGLDHTQFLGNTLPKIAKEKAGIIKTNVPVVISETQIETKEIFKSIAKEKNAEIYFADKGIQQEFETDLKGNYQNKNIKAVVSTISLLNEKAYSISETQLKTGLKSVIKNTGLKGRWQILQENPKVICDTAHNKEGLSYVVEQLLEESFNNLHIVFGTVNDKNLEEIIKLLPKKATYYLCKPAVLRGMEVKKLKQIFDYYSYKSLVYNSVGEALDSAKFNAVKNDLIYIGGSTFVVAEII